MYPYLLHIGPITIASFGLMVALGFLAALAVLTRELKRREVPEGEELASSIITTAMIGGLIGSKRTLCSLRPRPIWNGANFSM